MKALAPREHGAHVRHSRGIKFTVVPFQFDKSGLENDGVAHVALISRNNDKLADELLAEQDKTLQEIYFPETLIEEEAADTENSDAEGEPQETVNAETAQSTNETAPSAE